jgi:hypothetical protein
MNSFENIVRVLLERENLWVRQSEKVDLTKEEKRRIGKPSIPRPELDLVALNFAQNRIIVVEAKSYLDSPGVSLDELRIQHDVMQGRYKLFTCERYREIVFERLREDYINQGLADAESTFTLGLAAGKVYRDQTEELRAFFAERGWFFWGPDDIAIRVRKLSQAKYEDDPVVMTAKLLQRV